MEETDLLISWVWILNVYIISTLIFYPSNLLQVVCEVILKYRSFTFLINKYLNLEIPRQLLDQN